MGYCVFNAVGQVRDVTERQTSNGGTGKVILLLLGTSEWNGQCREQMLEVSAWGKVAEQCASLAPGQTVSVSGTMECQQSERGYWNPRIRVREVVTLRNAQAPQQGYAPQGYAPQGYAQPAQQQPALYDADIPF